MNSRLTKALLVLGVLSVLLATPILAQTPRGAVTGTVTGPDGSALPGVLVTASSPNLQGTRTTTTAANGAFRLAQLPPGQYQLSFELDGFSTASQSVRVFAAQDYTSDVQLAVSDVTETITVTSMQESISESITASSSYSAETMDKLPVGRTINNAVALAPGTHGTGPSGNATINGSMSFENLYTVNGVVVNENVRGQALNLFIEDAIQEQNIQTSGISAEYGRFSGGVINVLTKSGGNQFSGSLRVSFDNEDWEAKTPLTVTQEDTVNDTYEATFGGPFYRDHLWFFGAGRDRETAGTGQTNSLNLITYPTKATQQRIEGKLTATLVEGHQLVGSYLEIDQENVNAMRGDGSGDLDLGPVSPSRTDPQELWSVNYTGILTPNFFIEGQYSERDFIIGRGSGGPQDLIDGTFLRTRADGGLRYHAPLFCGGCEDELRNNENLLAKGSYFLTTSGAGTHDISFGYDTFSDIRFSVNHQSGSDFQVWSTDTLIDSNQVVFPVIGNNTWIVWWPPVGLDIARPTDFTTNSFYVNDAWQLNDKWSFNIGVRYDQNDGKNGGGTKVSDDSEVSPRLGLSYDVKGDGDLVFSASAGRYVAAIANTRADATSQGGNLAGFGSFYGGPLINTDSNCLATGTCVTSAEALEIIFDWYFGAGAPACGRDASCTDADLGFAPNLIFASIPGVSAVIPDGGITSPSVDEYSFGVLKRLGNKGVVRADLTFRDQNSFYADRVTLDTVRPDLGVDLTEVGNFDNGLKREYKGLSVQAQYRFNDRFTLAGTYTLSELKGNINGENAGSGPIPAGPDIYPEYREERWNYPTGKLLADQRHKLRLWAIYEILNGRRNNLSLGALTSYLSGTPYSAAGSVEPIDYVNNPGYLLSGASVPTTVGYFFSERGAFTTDDISRTDLSLTYSFNFDIGNRPVSIFIQPIVTNIFNEDGVDTVDTTILDATNGDFAPFNPFTDTPVQGVNWDFGQQFGQPETTGDYQNPRTFTFSVGFRF